MCISKSPPRGRFMFALLQQGRGCSGHSSFSCKQQLKTKGPWSSHAQGVTGILEVLQIKSQLTVKETGQAGIGLTPGTGRKNPAFRPNFKTTSGHRACLLNSSHRR